jgi:ribokinase
VKRITVVGSYNVGLMMTVERLPRDGETLLGSGYSEGPGGKGSNQAVAAARLGAASGMVCCVGNDRWGDEAIALWRSEGVREALVKRVDVHTGLGFVIVAKGGQNVITVDPGANMRLRPEDVERAGYEISRSSVMLAQLEVPVETVVAAAEIARRAGVTTVLNPAPARRLSAEQLSLFDVITPNRQEFQEMVGQDSLEDGTRELLNAGAKAVVVTLGEEGAFVAVHGDGYRVPAPRVVAVDPTGAGDAFSAALSVALAEGEPLRSAVTFANHAGALATKRMGVVPALPRRAEVEEFLRDDILE